MSPQHDFIIDNSTGANVRADINSVLQAIASNNSGSSAPSTTYALQTFANTTDSMLQLRNSANNAFVNLRKFDGTLPLPDGSAASPSLFFDDDTNTGIFSSSNDVLNFATGGVERLHLAGGTCVFNEDGADVDFRIEGDTDVNNFYLDASTNRIGIGQSSPEGKLHIEKASSGAAYSPDGSDILIIENNDSCGIDLRSPSANSCGINFSDTVRRRGGISYSHSSDSLHFLTAGNFVTTIDSSGNVGIGTTSPVGKLTVNSGNITLSDGFGFTNGADADKTFMAGTSGASGNLTFGVNNTERMRMNSSGHVLINTTQAFNSLNGRGNLVVGSGSGNEGITIFTGSSNQGGIAFADGTSGNAPFEGLIEYNHSNNSFTFTTAAQERMRIDSSGRLLVGRTNNITVGGDASDHCFEQRTNNGYTLTIHADQTNQRGLGMFYTASKTPEAFMFCEVSGSNRFIISGSGNVTNANNSYGQISDISLKENIVNANSQWDDIKNLKIRNFNFKSSTGYDTHTQIGLVAQEVETVSPKLVDTDEDGIKRISSSVLYMKAVKCLQEAIAKIEVLETKVAALEAA